MGVSFRGIVSKTWMLFAHSSFTDVLLIAWSCLEAREVVRGGARGAMAPPNILAMPHLESSEKVVARAQSLIFTGDKVSRQGKYSRRRKFSRRGVIFNTKISIHFRQNMKHSMGKKPRLEKIFWPP